MKAKAKFFDPLYGWVQKGQYIPNDNYGYRLKAAGHVVPDDEYETKVLRPKPTRRRKNAKPDDQQSVVDQSGEAGPAADAE